MMLSACSFGPCVSVIVPVYNAEMTIERCVRSILSSSWNNLDILLIDDGSCDQSGKICDYLAEVDPRIRVLHKENGGVGSARNAGIQVATGEYMAFVDADDSVEKNMFEILVRNAEHSGADCVVCCIVNEYAFSTKVEKHVFGNQVIQGRNNIESRILIPMITPGHEDGVLLQSVWNKLYRKEIAMQRDLQFSSLSYAEDWLFNIEFFKYCNSIIFIPDVLYRYNRTEEDSLSKIFRKDDFKETIWIQNRLAHLFPQRYLLEQLYLGVLGIQADCLRNYIYFCGVTGFKEYVDALFVNPDLIKAYCSLEQIPAKYRFAKICVKNGWQKGYYLWCMNQVKVNIVKRCIRKILLSLKKPKV